MDDQTNIINEEVCLVVVAEGEKTYAKSVVESFRICIDYENISVIVYDNSKDDEFRLWAQEQDDFILAYSEDGVLSYGEVILDLIEQIVNDKHMLLVPDGFLLIPGTLSGMIDVLNNGDNIGLLGGNYNGNFRYGLGKEALCRDYNDLYHLSQTNDYYPWHIDILDENGPMLINKTLINKLSGYSELRLLDGELFRIKLCGIATQYMFDIVVDAAHFWWNCGCINDRKNEESILSPFFTIGVPSYNRGHRALETVTHLLEDRARYNMEDDVEIVVSDNASIKNIEGYERINELAKNSKNFIFYRADNHGFLLDNLNNILSLATGQFCMMLSDEDRVCFAGLIYYINYLKKHLDIGVMKGWSNLNYRFLRPMYQSDETKAALEFYLRDNYLSGVIWNRSIITSELIGKIKTRYDDDRHSNRAFLFYSHMFLDTYALIHGAFAGSDIPLIEEGVSEENGHNTVDVLPYATPEERILQAVGYMPFIRDLQLSDNLTLTLYLLTVDKTICLLKMSKESYIRAGLDWNNILVEFKKRMLYEYDSFVFNKSDEYNTILQGFLDDSIGNSMDKD